MKPVVTHYDTETDEMTIALNSGGKLTFNMRDEYVSFYGSVCDILLEFYQWEDFNELFFYVGGEVVSLRAVKEWALENYESIRDETLQEEEDERAMREELSSPYLTGRI